ncbi:hypothetical protein CR513_34698, partial [Mucuna pruriens]
MKHEKAMDSEINSIKKNQTWEPMDLPIGAKTIRVKWIFKMTLSELGNVKGTPNNMELILHMSSPLLHRTYERKQSFTKATYEHSKWNEEANYEELDNEEKELLLMAFVK